MMAMTIATIGRLIKKVAMRRRAQGFAGGRAAGKLVWGKVDAGAT